MSLINTALREDEQTVLRDFLPTGRVLNDNDDKVCSPLSPLYSMLSSGHRL